MKKILLGLYLILVASAVCFAQSALWAGNAARGNDDAYPASVRASGKAAGMSLALPEGTLVQVKNQKNGQTADVTIVAGQGKPGIFLLLNSAASDALDIHAGEVIMVEIREKSAVSNPFLDYSADPDRFKKSLNDEIVSAPQTDPDNAAAVDVEGEMSKMGYEAEEPESPAAEVNPDASAPDEKALLADEEEGEASDKTDVPPLTVGEAKALEDGVDAEESPAEEIVIPETDGTRDFEEIVIADSEDSYDAVLDYREEVPEEEAVIEEEEPAPEEKPVVTESVPAESEAEAAPEEPASETPFLTEDLSLGDLKSGTEPAKETVPAEESAAEPERTAEKETPPVDPDRVIYFLTPAELRPPEPIENEESPLPVWEKEENVLTVAPSTDGADVGETVSAGETAAGTDADIVISPESEAAEAAAKEEPEIHFRPQYVDLDELEKYIRETLEDGSRYVQVASFGEEDYTRIYDNMVNLQKSFPYLPMILLPGKGTDKSTLKLMVGPVSRDEVGILLYAMKARGFGDAFLNRE